MQPLKNGQWISNAERNLKAIRKLGAENSILSTDCGNPATPPWEGAACTAAAPSTAAARAESWIRRDGMAEKAVWFRES